MLKTLQELCEINGTSGSEDAVRAYIIDKLEGRHDYQLDNVGNIIVYKKGKSSYSIWLSAHMDEVGMMVSFVEEDGTLRFQTVGRIDTAVLAGSRVKVGPKGCAGVIGTKPIHLLSQEDRKQEIKLENLRIDIGASSREEAVQLASPGDCAYFDSQYVNFGDQKVKAKAIDDRFGCALLLRLLEEVKEPAYDLTVAFTTKEETGGQGALVGANGDKSSTAIVLEATSAGDLADLTAYQQICSFQQGPVVSYMDNRTIYDKSFYRYIMNLAQKSGIPAQTKTQVCGGNDAGVIQNTGNGKRCIGISLPCRYIHSPSCVADKRDIEAGYQLTKAIVQTPGMENL